MSYNQPLLFQGHNQLPELQERGEEASNFSALEGVKSSSNLNHNRNHDGIWPFPATAGGLSSYRRSESLRDMGAPNFSNHWSVYSIDGLKLHFRDGSSHAATQKSLTMALFFYAKKKNLLIYFGQDWVGVANQPAGGSF